MGLRSVSSYRMTLDTYRCDGGDEQTGSWHGTVQHLEREEAILMGQTETLHDASGQILESTGRRATL